MNVLYLSYDGALDPLGGSQVVPYLEALSGLGHRFDLVTFEKPARWSVREQRLEMQSRLAAARIAWHPLKYHKRFSVGATAFDLARARPIASKLVGSEFIDLIHVRSYPPAIVARSVACRTGVPYLFDMRGLYAEERVDGGLWPADGLLYRTAKRVETSLLKDAAAVVTLTETSVPVVRSLMERAGSRAELAVIPTCVDLERFRLAPNRSGRPCLAYIGSIGTWYMLEEMLAFARAAVDQAGARLLLLINDSPWSMATALERAGLADDDVEVRSVPYAEVPAALAGVTATFCFIRPAPSKVASAATKVSESLALGLPVGVNRGIGDSADIVDRHGVGVVVDPHAPETFAAAATRLLALGADDSVRVKCRSVAEERFDLAGAVKRYDHIYTAMVAGRDARR